MTAVGVGSNYIRVAQYPSFLRCLGWKFNNKLHIRTVVLMPADGFPLSSEMMNLTSFIISTIRQSTLSESDRGTTTIPYG